MKDFAPRGLPNMAGFNAPRAMLAAPPPMLGDPRGLRPMASLMGGHIPRGMVINQFNRFPRFGVVNDGPPRHLEAREEELPPGKDFGL